MRDLALVDGEQKMQSRQLTSVLTVAPRMIQPYLTLVLNLTQNIGIFNDIQLFPMTLIIACGPPKLNRSNTIFRQEGAVQPPRLQDMLCLFLLSETFLNDHVVWLFWWAHMCTCVCLRAGLYVLLIPCWNVTWIEIKTTVMYCKVLSFRVFTHGTTLSILSIIVISSVFCQSNTYWTLIVNDNVLWPLNFGVFSGKCTYIYHSEHSLK